MLVVHIVGIAILAFGLALFAADQLLGKGRGEAGGGIWKLQITGPPGLLLALIGVLVFLFPFSPWWRTITDTSSPAASTSSVTGGSSSPVILPAAGLIYNQPVGEAANRLSDAGLEVRDADIGCSDSTQPGFVRQVTVGSAKNVHIIYGKATDEVDEVARSGLVAGDQVTVWYPSENPCP
jgi:hypothetical protein